MPLVAVTVLALGMRYPLLRVFNIVFVAFGLMALVRSLLHIRAYGSCGLGGHVVAGAILNLVLLALIVLYVFTAIDPLGIRPA